MNKVKFRGHPDFVRQAQQDITKHLCTVDVIAKGKKFHEETLQARGTVGTEGAMSDSDLEDKFRHNAERILTQDKINIAIEHLLNLENVDRVPKLSEVISI